MSTETQSPSGASTAPYEFVSSSVDGPVGIVTLNRPKQLNALALPLVQERGPAPLSEWAEFVVTAPALALWRTYWVARSNLEERVWFW